MRVAAPLLSLCLIALCSNQASAWGERGHNAIARVATRIVANSKDPDTAAFGAVLQKREHMLGHLANVPDIVWRSGGPEVEAANAPSHFIDLDYILPADQKLELKDCPTDFASYKKALAANCSKQQLSCAPGQTEAEKLNKAGHAPFRIQRMSEDLTKLFAEIKRLESDPKAKPETRQALIDQALLFAGIMAHYVGDLANPHHTAADYDGWHTEQGGLHGYFESDQVDAQNLELEQTILDAALKNHPAQKIFSQNSSDPLLMSWQLTIESHARIPALLELDRKNSLVKKSDQALRIKAQRKPSAEVAGTYREFLVERLTIGADATAQVWVAAWQAGGKPKLQGFSSYNYPVKPEFIPLGYVTPPVVAAQAKAKPSL